MLIFYGEELMKPAKSFSKPVLLLFIMIVSMFFAEIVVTFFLSVLPPLSVFKTTFLDGLFLTVIMFPSLYFLIVKPLRLHMGEQEFANKLLRDSEEKYRSLVESTDDSIYLVDKNYRYLFMNEKHLSRLGLLKDEYVGHEYSEFHSSDETKWFIEKVDSVLNSGESLHHEHKSPRDGRYYLLTLSPVRDSDRTIIAITIISKDITDRRAMEEKVRFLSLTDDLTGLYNRRGFFTLGEQQLKLAKRMKTGIFMLYADVDNLKQINDTWGHQEGDLSLIEAANILKRTFRESDIIARIGGDEFVVIPIGIIGDNVETITGRMQKNLEASNAETKRNCNLSLSFGIVYYDPGRPCSVNELLAQGDTMMYEQKSKKHKS